MCSPPFANVSKDELVDVDDVSNTLFGKKSEPAPPSPKSPKGGNLVKDSEKLAESAGDFASTAARSTILFNHFLT